MIKKELDNNNKNNDKFNITINFCIYALCFLMKSCFILALIYFILAIVIFS